MNFNLEKEKKFFFFYLLFLIIFSIIFLYEKHNVGNDSTISEWLINYQGGFVRRGLIGDIIFNISKFFNLKIRFVIFLFQVFFYIFFILLIFNYFKKVKLNFLSALAVYTPIFLLYPVAEKEVLARKETIIFLFFLFFLIIASKKYDKKYLNAYSILILPITIFIWEPVVFFYTFIFFILYLKNFNGSFLKTFVKVFLIILTSIVSFLFIILNPLGYFDHEVMCYALKNNFNEECYMSLSLLKSKSGILRQFTDNFPVYKLQYFIRYFIIFIIGFLPLLLLSLNSNFRDLTLINNKNKNFINILLILLTFVPICFAAMYDWGRVINISYTFSVLTFFYLIKNNIIICLNTGLIKKINIFFFKHLNFYYIFFFIYSFCWHAKTVISDKVGTIPIYKIFYKGIKSIANTFM